MSTALLILLCVCCTFGGVILGFALGEKTAHKDCKFMDRFGGRNG